MSKEAETPSDADTGTARDPTQSEDSNTARDPSIEEEAIAASAVSAESTDEPEVAEPKPVKEYNTFGTSQFGGEEVDMVEVMKTREHELQVKSSSDLKKERKAKSKSDRTK